MKTAICSLSTAALLSALAPSGAAQTCSQRWVDGYGSIAGGWGAEHPRFLADVNGDGNADVVGFASSGVFVSTSTGTGFAPETQWLDEFGFTAGGWRVGKHPRMMADVNGDGRQDVVGFANDGVYVALSTGNSFTRGTRWVTGYGYAAGGWRVDQHPRMMADVDGDGRQDVVGFANDGVYVSLSTGRDFLPEARWVADYGLNVGGWQVGIHPRMLADIDGDGRQDIIGIAINGVFVSLSTGTAFTQPQFGVDEFGFNRGWRVGVHPRMMADVNGDGRQDVVGFASDGVYVAVAVGAGQFSPARNWTREFGTKSSSGEWKVSEHPRFLADVNGDGRADIVGLADNGIQRALSTGSSFLLARHSCAAFGRLTGGWQVGANPRMMADIDGDGRQDVVGFGAHGVDASTDLFTNAFGPQCGPRLSAHISHPDSQNSRVEIQVRSALPSTPLAVLAFGFDKRVISLPGCDLQLEPFATLPVTVASNGTSSFSITLPIGVPPVHSQFLSISASTNNVRASTGLTLLLD